MRILVVFLLALMSAACASQKGMNIDASNSSIAHGALAERGVTVSLKEEDWTPYYFLRGKSYGDCDEVYMWFNNHAESIKVKIMTGSQCFYFLKEKWQMIEYYSFRAEYGDLWETDNRFVTKKMQLGSGEEVTINHKIIRSGGHKRNIWLALSNDMWKGKKDDGLMIMIYNYKSEEEIPSSMVEEILASIHITTPIKAAELSSPEVKKPAMMEKQKDDK